MELGAEQWGQAGLDVRTWSHILVTAELQCYTVLYTTALSDQQEKPTISFQHLCSTYFSVNGERN